MLKQINADASGKPQNDIPEEVKEVAGKLAKAFGARVEIHRIEIPEKKRKFRKKPRKEQGNETRMAVIPGGIGESKRNRNNTFVNADV